jgi:SPOR domain
MGPNSFRNLTYLAVLAVVGALVYLIYQSSKKQRERLNPSIETPLGGIPDSLGSMNGASTAVLPTSGAMAGDTVGNAVDGTLLTRPGAKGGASAATSLASPSDVKDVTVNDQGSPAAAGSGSGSTKGSASASGSKPHSPAVGTSKGGAAAGHGGTAAAPKFNAGDGKGEFMVVTGAFSSKDNAQAQVTKLKTLGFAGAETVKLENSASTYAIAGYYAFKGGADAAVRTLKVNKIEAYAKKRNGEVYKPSTPAPKPVAKPVAVAKPS